jgi:hypothetical protein
MTWKKRSLRSQARNPITVGYQDKPRKLTLLRRWCQSYFGLITTRSTANEPGRLGDTSRRMGRIRSRIAINVIERLWSNWSFKTIYDQSKMGRKSPIHAIIKPPDKQSSNYNSSCTMKEAITNISQQLKYSNWYEDIVMKIWKFDAKKMLSVGLISNIQFQ